MGLSGSKKTKTKSTSSEMIAPNPVYAGAIDAANATLNPAYQEANINNKQQLYQVGQVQDFYKDTMNGKYLSGNPWLDNVIDSSGRDITRGVQSQFEGAGRYGSGNFSGVLARALADNSARLRYGDYASERGYQDAAGQKVLQGTTIAAALPQAASSTYADAVAALLGKYASSTGSGTNTTKESGGLLGQLLAAGAQVGSAALMASDPRLKREITKIGELADGLGVYIWRYVWGIPAVGVMADEVAEKRPWALGPTLHGFATVNYGAL